MATGKHTCKHQILQDYCSDDQRERECVLTARVCKHQILQDYCSDRVPAKALILWVIGLYFEHLAFWHSNSNPNCQRTVPMYT